MPCVVFLHGLGSAGICFQQAGRCLKGENAVLIPDLAGFGNSGAPPGFPFTLKAQAELVAGLCRRKGMREIAVVGHSMGGAVGILLSEAWSGGVSHFVNAVGNLGPSDATFSRKIAAQGPGEFRRTGFKKFKAAVGRARRLGRIGGCYAETLEMTSARAMYLSSVDLVELSDRGELLRRFIGSPARKAYFKDSRSDWPRGLREALALGGVSIVEIPGTGHSLMEDAPEEFFGAVEKFLGALPPAKR
jgi:pimeloyl-ACP methyl ester carboxylesterase